MFDADYLLQIRIQKKNVAISGIKENLSAPSDLKWAHSPAFNKLKYICLMCIQLTCHLVKGTWLQNYRSTMIFFLKHVCMQR